MKTVKRFALLVLLVLAPLQAPALDSDREQPIEVEADRLEIRELENISIYEGNVKLVQGSLQINSDRLVIHFDENQELTLLEMTGKPARFRQLDNAQQEMLGAGEQIDYIESQSLLELRVDASFSHVGDLIKSELIRINTQTNAIEAGGTQAEDRVKMVIKPRPAAGGAQPPGSNQTVDE
jgi:lipopolysaccharide export system protein LptA